MTPPRRPAAAATLSLAALLLACLLAPAATAQSPHPVTSADGPSSLPAGPGAIRGVIRSASAAGQTGGLDVALYALQPDGTPGIGGTRTADDGSFAFEQLAVDPSIVYLVGVRFAGIPFGERVRFGAGQTEVALELAVSAPVADGRKVRVVETTVIVQSLGARLSVEELHRLSNEGDAPVLVPAASRGDATLAPFEARLPEGASDFQPGVLDAPDAFQREGRRLVYWGPVYPGEQQLRFSYQVPVPQGAEELPLALSFPRGTGRVRLLRSPHGPELSGPDLRPGAPGEGEDGLTVLQSAAVSAGGSLAVSVRVPDTVDRPDAISIRRAELAIELDDTVLEVTQSQQVVVAPGPHVSGRPGAPLLRFEVPQRAELVGLSTDAGQLGAVPAAHGVEVLGPLAPGTHELAFRYRLPADPGGTDLDLLFPATVATLVVRAADTGLVIHSDRLHRLRPQAMGTRTWMFREAFHVEANERVSLRFEPLEARGPSRLGGLFFLASAGAIVLLFVVSPLRATRQVRAHEADDRHGPAHERDLVYATIRDLEHDFETGKVAQEDFERTRAELWARAKELMQRERRAAPATGATAPASAPAAAPAAEAPASAATAGFCPACGKPVDAAWRFCSHCGGGLAPAGTDGEPTG